MRRSGSFMTENISRPPQEGHGGSNTRDTQPQQSEPDAHREHDGPNVNMSGQQGDGSYQESRDHNDSGQSGYRP